MPITFEQARSVKFNIKMFFVSNIVFLILGMYAAYRHLTGDMDPVIFDYFSKYIEAILKSWFLPINHGDADNFLSIMDGVPKIKAEFNAYLTIIFKWTPIGIVITNVVFWITAHALKGYLKQKKAMSK